MVKNKSHTVTKTSPLKENKTPSKTDGKWIKPKNFSLRSPIVTRQSKRKRSTECPPNQRTIKSYFKKPDETMIKSSAKKVIDEERRYNKIKVKHFTPTVKFKSCISPSAKLESKVPKIDDILRSREESEKYIELKRMVDASAEKFLMQTNAIKHLEDAITPVVKPKQSGKVKDCKDLSLKDLEKRFKMDHKFLDDLTYDRVYNKRHELFKKDTPKNNFTKNDLRVNETTSAFTEDQLIYIISLFRNRYDNGNIYKYSDFYFKVLLPEYCLKIFMEYHKMEDDKALEYLKSLPVPNYFGLTE